MTTRRSTRRRSTPSDHGGPVWVKALPVRDWMHAGPLTVRATTPVGVAARMMRRRNIRHLPVVDFGRRLVGIVTDRDLRQFVFDSAIRQRLGRAVRGLDDIPLREVMTWAVVSVNPNTDLRDVARLMHERKIGALPVVDDGKVVGIVTETDVLGALDGLLRHRVTRVRPLAGTPSLGRPYDYGFAAGDTEAIEP